MKTKRKFAPQRIYKLIKWVVNVVAILSLLSFVFSYLQYDNVKRWSSDFEKQCISEIDGNDFQSVMNCKQVALQSVIEHEHKMNYYLEFGIILLIVYWSGLGIYNFIFPKVEKDES